jgi:hypothetical protein
MTTLVRSAALLGAVTQASCAGRPLPTARVAPLFGPAVGSEAISGHVAVGNASVVLMAGGTTIVQIDLDTRDQRTTVVQLPGRERCWGLARLADGSVWTLMGRNAAIEVASDGSVRRTLALSAPQFGLFGVADRLIFQGAGLSPGAPALFAGAPDDPARTAWSALTTRSFEQLAGGAAAALNLVACGVSHSGEVPCWFPDEPAISLIGSGGATRRLELAGLPRVAPEVLINAAAPPRPVRDVFVERDGTIWVISTGKPPAHGKNLPGGWLLARYGRRGEPIDRRLLPEPARLILRAGGGRALVLTGSGMIAEVLP